MKTSAWRRTWEAKCVGVLVSTGLAFAAPSFGASARPTLHPGSEHYRAVASSAAIGRSGSATFSARALLSRTGKTDLDMTTGILDSTTPAVGNIAKVQLKTFDSSGRVRSTRNFKSLSGATANLPFSDMARGEPFQVQANLTGIDGARTDVITVRGTVKLRDDLTVPRVSMPSSAALNSPVNISAEISERNGDTAATADCVLSVDGSEADRAPGVWVSAGRTISCAFVYRFTTAGTHTAAVKVTNVVPADDDATNNSSSSSITITQSSHFKYTASVQSYQYQSSSTDTSSYGYDDGSSTSGSDFSYTTQTNGQTQQISFAGQIDQALGFPLSVDMTEASGTQTLAPAFANVTADWSKDEGGATRACASRFDGASAAYLFLCTLSNTGAPQTSVTYSRYGGDVTYFSSQFSNYWWQDDASGQRTDSPWTYNTDYTATQGVWIAVGTDFSVAAKITSGDASYSAKADIKTSPYSLSDGSPYACTDYSSGSTLSKSCSGWSQTQTGVSGQVSGQN